MESRLHAILLRGVPVGSTFFEEFVKECKAWYEQPAHSMTELRTRLNTKLRGDIFEEFCVLYMKHVRGYPQVWRLEDVPDEILGGLGLKRQDMGIDLICERNGRYTAVQCKYKKHTGTKSKTIVTWSQLSTFYALVLRTGPWETYAVMTNCDYVRHMGKKTPKDLSICFKTFKRITSEQWTQMCGLEGHRMTEAPKPTAVLTLDQLRAARLARFTATTPVESNADGVHRAGAPEAGVD
jgi:hypothetical protein